MKVKEEMRNAKQDIHETITKYRLTHAEAIVVLSDLINNYAVEADRLCRDALKVGDAG